ncbi:MAG TPA: hypothetical protein VEH06_07870 [Candidatus Bathyarchaeia archaeon]|nr:hypothetical protein [Candidatus Bathyarchaeia archaeon]
MARIAQIAFKNKQIKTPSVSSLARACTYALLNQYRALEEKQRIIDEYERQRQQQAMEALSDPIKSPFWNMA